MKQIKLSTSGKRLFSTLLFVVFLIPLFAVNSGKILINEFLAANSKGLTDEDGDHSDWIELYNPGDVAINLAGWSLTDNANNLRKWTFPAISIGAGQYLVVFASSKNRRVATKQLHTSFSLSKDGEYLAIIEQNGAISYEYSPAFPPQKDDVSYGYYAGQHIYFQNPTPGAENTIENQAATPVFDMERGFYENPFSVTLTTNDLDTEIYYTTDGTRPTAKSTRYTAPILISKTTPLSAVGIKNDVLSYVITHTYFFVQDIVTQSQNPEGYPDRWGILGGDVSYNKYKVGERAPAHYGMEQDVCNAKEYKEYIKEAFASLPSVSIVTNPGYLFSDKNNENEGGIYIYTGVTTGNGWERPISLEYYEPDTDRQFQINCGLRIHGAASRQPEKTGKHSFRTYFRNIYESGKLRFDMFEAETSVNKFDHFVLRAGFGYSWMHWSSNDRNYSQYVVDAFAKRTQLNMGHKSAHNRFVHLFINGLYWGLYDLSERISNNFMEAYFGGEDVDYDVMNHSGLSDGSRSIFDNMVTLAQNGKYDELLSANLLDMENYIDYMLINFYVGNTDWGDNNWYAARNRVSQNEGFRFFCWDTENCFFSGLNYNVITQGGRFKGPLRKILFGSDEQSLSGGLIQNEEFKLLFADRVQKHFFNGGALSSKATAELYEKISDEIDLAVILESARWGAYRRKTLPGDGASPIYTRNAHWLPHKQNLLNTYFPARSGVVYNQLRNLGLLSAVDAPVFSSGGGEIENPIDLSISAAGNIYYTINGTDPREKGTGNLASSAQLYNAPLQIKQPVVVKARAKNGNAWSALSEVAFTSALTALNTPENEIVKLSYFDNKLQMEVSEEGHAEISIYSVEGKFIRKINQHCNRGVNRISLSNLSQGVYICKMHFNGKTYFEKFIY